MTCPRENNYGLNGNILKIIAALTMLIDHIGVVLLPDVTILRKIGRIAFPLYAFMIAEGCAYTKNKLRYFFIIFLLGAVCQIVYFIYDQRLYMGILIAFSLSILVVYALQYFKATLFGIEGNFIKRCVATIILLLSIVGVYILNNIFQIDYGFWGCMAPTFASLFRKPQSCPSAFWEKADHRILHILIFSIGLVIFSCVYGQNQPYSLFAIPILLLYSGKRGKANMKYFFYIFYPLHLIVLECIAYFSV